MVEALDADWNMVAVRGATAGVASVVVELVVEGCCDRIRIKLIGLVAVP